MKGKIYLVGAGPGEPGLITVRGLDLIKRCDAVIYDRLVSNELLSCTRPDCKKIYVGKQSGHHEKTQEEINHILLECAEQYDEVVRLKGGDPFVFGRGGEEAEVLIENEIDFEVIPGVTSAVAVPECVGIPVTHRGVSRSFHVITGHSNQGHPICNYDALVNAGGTLVFLMGLAHLHEITNGLLTAGMDKNVCAAVISEGTTGRQRTLRGTLKDISRKSGEQGIVSPAIIVIGETAGLCYQSRKEKLRIGITATPQLYEKLRASMEKACMEPVWICRMEVCVNSKSGLCEELSNLDSYHWIAFTGANGVQVFFDTVRENKTDVRKLGHLKFAVLGSGTAEKLSEYGIFADFIPSEFTTEVFAEEFAKVVTEGEKILIPRARKGNPRLTEILMSHKIKYTDLPIYDVKGTLTEHADEVTDLDYLVFASASGVEECFNELERMNISLPAGIRIACIGDMTAKGLSRKGRAADLVAKVPTAASLTEAILEYEKNKVE